MCPSKPDFQCLWTISRHLRVRAVNCSVVDRRSVIREFMSRVLVSLQLNRVLGCTSISVLGQILDPPLIECQCMTKIADVGHPINCTRQHVCSTCNPNGRNGIPKTSSSVLRGDIQKNQAAFAYQAPTKCTFTFLCENAFLKRSAIDISSFDPTPVTMCSSLMGSAYSSYALNMINWRTGKHMLGPYNGICISFPL